MARTKRAQILMEPGEYRQLERIARGEGKSVGELIREAVRARYLTGEAEASRLVREISDMRLPLPARWESLEGEIADARAHDLP